MSPSEPQSEPVSAAPQAKAPIEQILHDVMARLSALSESADAVLTCNGLVDIIGVRSHAVAILLFALLNLLPGPPGYSVAIGLAIMMFAWLLVLSKPMHLRPYVGERRLPLGLLRKCVSAMGKLVGVVAKVSSPRWSSFSSVRATQGIGIFIIIMGAIMLVPIPFTNTVPSAGTAIIAAGLLNRDGLAVAIGIIVGLIGVAILVVTLWAILALGLAVGDAIIE